MTNPQATFSQLGKAALAAKPEIAAASTNTKNAVLRKVADYLASEKNSIQAINRQEIATHQASLSDALIDRLTLSDSVIDSMIASLLEIAKLPDPVGSISQLAPQNSGILVGKMRVPLGVVGMIYESRPNVTIDAGALCIKSGNACILRSGKESLESSKALGSLFTKALQDFGLKPEVVQIIPLADRELVTAMLQAKEYLDVMIPRGGKGLVVSVEQHAAMPVIMHLDGNCHVFIDQEADPEKAKNIAINSKTHRYGVCNAMETLLVHKNFSQQAILQLLEMYLEKGVEIRGCSHTQSIFPQAIPATEEDWNTEYLAPILAVKFVDSLPEAIAHINHYGSGHTDAIVTENLSHARDFQRQVDSSSVIVNASTRFGDGFEFGLGAEIGISTNKLHVRGPVGLEGLTSEKYVVFGSGEVRS